jgi:hypothetical protein
LYLAKDYKNIANNLLNYMWIPFKLDSRFSESINDSINQIENQQENLDVGSLNETVEILNQLMVNNIHNIIDRDGMPYYCHIINGWGNVVYEGKTIIDYMETFVHLNKKGLPHIRQNSPEGDFHPWQTFAYLAMSGFEKEGRIGRHSIIETVKNSNVINLPSTESHDFGHLLFGYAYFLDNPDLEFTFKDTKLKFGQLLEKAIESHENGPFTVCRKVHLTEGIIATTNKFKEFEHLRKYNEYFLHGQLEILKLLGSLLYFLKTNTGKDTILYLQDLLKVGPYVENLSFYVGHLVELAMFAVHYGMTIPKEYLLFCNYTINRMNELIGIYQNDFEFEHCFLHLGHYRRSITLFKDLNFDCQKISSEILADFTLELNGITAISKSKKLGKRNEFLKTAHYEVTFDDSFEELINYSDKLLGNDLKARGRFPHFRRIIPNGWPRFLHYEYLLEENNVLIELHMESGFNEALKELLKKNESKLKEMFNPNELHVDDKWFGGNGYRIGLKFKQNATTKEEIAKKMEMLINATSPELNSIINER